MASVFDGMTVESILIELVEFRWHGMSPDNVRKKSTREYPVELILHDGRYIVHDGRHRILTGFLGGDTTVYARVWRA